MKISKRLFFPFALVMFFSCEDPLGEKTSGEWGNEDVWRIQEMAEGVLMKAYAGIDQLPDNGNVFLDAATDNALTNNYGTDVYRLASGQMTTYNSLLGKWGVCYENLQYIHYFLENGLSDEILYDRVSPDMDEAIKMRLEAEAYFLRAWWNFQLLMNYGGKTSDGRALGYPIVLESLEEDDARRNDFERATYAACAAQIMEDCDKAMVGLPVQYNGSGATADIHVGRATKFAAGVLKTRVALYAASPAYQPDAIVRINGMGDFTVVDENAYIANWERAAYAADELLKVTGFGNNPTALKSNQLADAPNATPADFVFRKYFNNRALETRHFPPFYYGSAGVVPSHNLVAAFPAKNGFPIGDSRANYSATEPYANRDDRLNLVAYYQGRMLGAYPIDVSEGGKDSRQFDHKASKTGYYLSKFISTNATMLTPTLASNVQHYNPILRKFEAFMNFAEAANEAWGPKGKGDGCKFSAYDIIKSVRQLSGGITNTQYLDEMAADKDSFRRLIQNERRLEFAFEGGQRYYDMRRWVLDLTETVTGVEVTRTPSGFSYSVIEVEPRKFDDIRNYYAPIPYDEIIKNPKLVNNLGW